MASFQERVEVLVDIVTSKGGAALKGLKDEVAGAEGAFGKMKAAGSGAFDAIGAAAPLALAGAGTAIAGFAAKAIGDFQNLALEVDNFTQKTGTSADAASRWVEVSKDLGVSSDAVATAFGRMERADAAGKLEEFSLSAGSASDRMAELLDKIGRIPDENERAAAAFKVFGKGWQELAPLLDTTEKLGDRLKEVGKGQLISDEQIRNAREFRDNMDDLRDAIEGVVNVIGAKLVAAINDVVAAAKDLGTPLTDIAGKANDVTDSFSGWFDIGGALSDLWSVGFDQATHSFDLVHQLTGGFLDMGDAVDALTTGFGLWGDSSDDAGKKTEVASAAAFRMAEGFNATNTAMVDALDVTKGLADAEADFTKRMQEQAKALQDAAKAQNDQVAAQRGAADATIAVSKATDDYDTFLGGLNKEIADAKGNQEKLNDINREAVSNTSAIADAVVNLHTQQSAANGTTITATEKFDLWGHSMIDAASKLKGPLQGAVLGYIGQVNDIPPDKLTEIQALIDQGKIDEAKTELDKTSAARTAAIIADAQTAQAEQDLNNTARTREATIVVKTIGGAPTLIRGAGGPVETRQAYIVGDTGPELFVPDSNGYVFAPGDFNVNDLNIPYGEEPFGPRMTGAYGAPNAGMGRVSTGWHGVNAPNILPSGQYNFSDASGATMWTVPVRQGAPSDIMPAGPGGLNRSTIIINMPPGSDGEDVVNALKRYERRNGVVPITVRRSQSGTGTLNFGTS